MRIDIWSDIACPFCYLGKGYLDTALDKLDPAVPVELTWRAMQLDPTPDEERTAQDKYEYVAGTNPRFRDREDARAAIAPLAEAARAAGLPFDADIVRPFNTYDAHRVLLMASERGLAGPAAMRVLRAYWGEGRAINDHGTLVELMAEVGLDADEVAAALAGDRYGDRMHADARDAARLGITGAPTYVIDDRYAITGAQPAEVMLRALEQVTAKP